jgi:hypothetical protein
MTENDRKISENDRKMTENERKMTGNDREMTHDFFLGNEQKKKKKKESPPELKGRRENHLAVRWNLGRNGTHKTKKFKLFFTSSPCIFVSFHLSQA